MSGAHAREQRQDRRTGPTLRVVDDAPADLLERPRPRLELVDYEPRPRDPLTGRRTVTIRGQVAARPRPSRTVAQASAHPDRVAMYAVLMGLFLVFMAVVTH